MADEQGVSTASQNRADGEFARQTTGRDVKADITNIRDLLTNVGVDGRQFQQRDSAPSNPEVGDVYLTDGTNWDPNAAGSPDLVVYDTSGGWTSIAVL